MEEGTPPRLAELHAELRGMTLGQLLEKAELVGVDGEALDDAEEEQKVIALIVAQLELSLAEASGGTDPDPEPGAEPELAPPLASESRPKPPNTAQPTEHKYEVRAPRVS